MKPKLCAIMRQSWYETARKKLSPEERLKFYELCYDFEFYGEEPSEEEEESTAVAVLFDMIKEDLREDIAKYQRIAERNRINGSRGGRKNSDTINPEEPRETQKNPEGLQSTIYNNTSYKEKECKEKDTHTQFLIALSFFCRGCLSPVEQMEKFWNYYKAIGWKNKNGLPFVDKMALANAWQLPECSKAIILARQKYAKALEIISKNITNETEFVLISEFIALSINNQTKSIVITYKTVEPVTILEKFVRFLVDTWAPKDSEGKLYNLSYEVENKYLAAPNGETFENLLKQSQRKFS